MFLLDIIYHICLIIYNIYFKLLGFIISSNKINNNKKILKKLEKNKKINIGLLTNEIPPIVYGGVATWIVNYIDMFKDDEKYNIVPIFLAYQDDLPSESIKKYKNIRIIKYEKDIDTVFEDIDICVNNLWIALDVIDYIKNKFDDLVMITVCHSLIQMEHLTNLSYCYTNNFNDQENTFAHSDHIVLISEAEKEYYESFNYDILNPNTSVIYNSYKPKYDNNKLKINYKSNNIGYIGRHVPRKRPELPILSINNLNLNNVKVYNMGVDYDKYDNKYWREMENKYEQLIIIPFTSNPKKKNLYWRSIGINCITGIYEPFGYTICETIDRRVPALVSNIDGPAEIIKGYEEYVYTYDVDKNNYKNDIINFSNSLQNILNVSPKEREENANKLRKCLDNFRPEKIKLDWISLFEKF